MEGSIKGLRARGAVVIDLNWKDGKGTLAVLRPRINGEHKLRAARGQKIIDVLESTKKLPVQAAGDGLLTVQVVAGKKYEIKFS